MSVNVTNTGAVAGTETIQLYMQDVTASIVRPVKELKNFAKAELKAGESKIVTMTLEKANMGFYDDFMNYKLEDGKFRIYVGGDSRNCLNEELVVKF